MMTLEEAIEHCKEFSAASREAALSCARENAYEIAISCKAVGYEHEQIAEWLIELKQRREAEITAPPKSNGDRIRNMTDSQISEMLVFDKICSMCTGADSVYCGEPDFCKHSIEEWLGQVVSEDD